MKLTKILLDVMGTENGPCTAISASQKFLLQHDNVHITFVGKKALIEKYCKKLNLDSSKYSIENAKQVITAEDGILAVRRKNDASMIKALNLMNDSDKYDCIISGGSTAAYVAGCHLILGEIPPIKKSGYMVFVPTIVKDKFIIFLDVGANLVNSGLDLYYYASLANIYAKSNWNIKSPKIGLLNIGTESNKGFPYHFEAHELLTKDKDLDFYGNIEPRELLNGRVDIVVSDGYTGNLVLKALEGCGESIFIKLKELLSKNTTRKIWFWIGRKPFYELKKTFDYKNYAAAIVAGTSKLAIKTHGSVDEKSFIATLRIAYNAHQNKVMELIKKHLKESNEDSKHKRMRKKS